MTTELKTKTSHLTQIEFDNIPHDRIIREFANSVLNDLTTKEIESLLNITIKIPNEESFNKAYKEYDREELQILHFLSYDRCVMIKSKFNINQKKPIK